MSRSAYWRTFGEELEVLIFGAAFVAALPILRAVERRRARRAVTSLRT
jgi:hypothetical protein